VKKDEKMFGWMKLNQVISKITAKRSLSTALTHTQVLLFI